MPVKQFWKTWVRMYTENLWCNHGKLYNNAVPVFMGYTVLFDPCYTMGKTRTIQYGYDDNGDARLSTRSPRSSTGILACTLARNTTNRRCISIWNGEMKSWLLESELATPKSARKINYTLRFNEVESGVYTGYTMSAARPSVRVQNRVHSVSSTILAGSTSECV